MKTLIYLFLILLNCYPAIAQHKHKVHKKKNSYFNTPEDWYRQVEGKPFPLPGIYKSTDGKTRDFSHLHHANMVCFGFAACPPCRHELPVYIAAAGKYPDIDFVYITYDSEEVRLKELKEIGLDNFQPPGNYYILHLDQQVIDRYNLTLAYPTQYFISADGLVRYMNSGGDPDEPVAEVEARIERIISGKEW